VLCEIQQNSDVTYRLWDYGRPREIHVDQAVAIADLGVHPGAARPIPLPVGREELVRSKHFITEMVPLAAAERLIPTPEKCQLWIAIEGAGSIGGQPFRAGEVWLLPEQGEQPVVATDTGAKFLRTYAPS